MKTMICVAGIALIGVLGGCGIERQPGPSKTFFMLDVSPQPAPGRSDGTGCLYIRPVNVPTAFAGTALIYRTGELTWEKDYYNQFLVAPDQQLGRLLEALLRPAGGADCEGEADPPRLILEPHLEAFYADFRRPEAPSAYVKIRFVVTRYDRSCRCSSIQQDESLESTVALPAKPTPEAIVEAMGRAVEDILQRFDPD